MHEFGEVFGHPLGQHGHQAPIAFLRHRAHFVEKVVDLIFRRPDLDGWIDEAGWANDLLGESAARLFQLPAARRRRNKQRLRPHRFPFFEPQRTIVHARRQPEAVLGQRRLAPVVAAEHAPYLRHRDVAFISENERVIWQILKQRRRRVAGTPAGEITRIVFDARTRARRLHHFHIESRALFQALGFEQFARRIHLVEPLLQFRFDRFDCLLQRRLWRHVVRVGVDFHQRQFVGLGASERIEFDDRFNFIPKQREPPGPVFQMRGKDFDRIAARAERSALEVDVVAAVMERHEIGQQLIARQPFALAHGECHGGISFNRADTVDA